MRTLIFPLNLLGWRLEGGTIKYLGSLISDVCVFNIFKNLEVGICFKIQVIDIDVHICFKIDMIVIACLLVASGSVSLVS